MLLRLVVSPEPVASQLFNKVQWFDGMSMKKWDKQIWDKNTSSPIWRNKTCSSGLPNRHKKVLQRVLLRHVAFIES